MKLKSIETRTVLLTSQQKNHTFSSALTLRNAGSLVMGSKTAFCPPHPVLPRLLLSRLAGEKEKKQMLSRTRNAPISLNCPVQRHLGSLLSFFQRPWSSLGCCLFRNKISLFGITITRTMLFCVAEDLPLSLLKASEVRWNLTSVTRAFVSAFNCCTPGCILTMQLEPPEQRVPERFAACCNLQDGNITECAEVRTPRTKILFQNVFLSPVPGNLKRCCPFFIVNRFLGI